MVRTREELKGQSQGPCSHACCRKYRRSLCFKRAPPCLHDTCNFTLEFHALRSERRRGRDTCNAHYDRTPLPKAIQALKSSSRSPLRGTLTFDSRLQSGTQPAEIQRYEFISRKAPGAALVVQSFWDDGVAGSPLAETFGGLAEQPPQHRKPSMLPLADRNRAHASYLHEQRACNECGFGASYAREILY